MEFSTEAVGRMAEIMVQEMNRMGREGEGIRMVETTMRGLLRQVGAQALGTYLEQRDEQLSEREVSCACGAVMEYRFKREAIILSVFGRVSYRRKYHTCEHCHVGQAPLDRVMGIEAGQVSAGLAELLALAGVEVAFEEAARWLEHYLLFRVSDNTLRKETERFGELQKAQEAEWQQKSQEEAWLQQRQADLYEELVFVCDGAVWIWRLIERHFPHAVQIVDWYHACEYLAPIAEAAFGKETEPYQIWLENTRALLWEGQIDQLIYACQQLASVSAAKPVVHSAVTYFSNNQKRMDYARFRQQGYFIGSGTVESGGKQISTLRLKRAGARWTEGGAVQTAKARAAWLSRGWEVLASKRASLPLAA